jgi:hypothetical protein
MASQRGVIGPVVRNHAPAERNGELVDDLADGQRGDESPVKGKRRRAKISTEKGRGRNIKMPDGLYDQLCLFARRSKVTMSSTDRTGKQKEWKRSMTVSEAVCLLVERGLPGRYSIVEDADKNGQTDA